MAVGSVGDRFARGWAVLRGAMLVVVSATLLLASEKVVQGSSTGPAHDLAMMFGSRTILFGLAIAGLAIKGKRRGLAWLLFADAAFQVFDTGLAVSLNKGALSALPALLGAIDVFAGLKLFRFRE
jgi:hypothetical protein